ncbi:MAG: sugar phosphate nucleotidyltransferase [Acidobacteriota bacterium]|nr:sugar phosphate nucleotidyltransferase [Acidobacteriota bacterium]
MAVEKLTTHAIILAGGRGTRFWPRSRTRTPKQLLNIIGSDSMLQQTVARLTPLIPAQRIWTVTNVEQAASIRKHLPASARKHVLAEPIGRSTAAAIALAAIHIRKASGGDALMAILPADLYIARPQKYRKIMRLALQVAREPGRMVVLGIPPTRPETGFGYIQCSDEPISTSPFPVFPVRAFKEKPDLQLAKKYVGSGNYHWNAGMFFWRVSTFLDALKKYLPKTSVAIESLASSIGTKGYEKKFRSIYPRLENIAVDYAILEAATREKGPARVFAIPAEIGWSDIGSWTAVHEQSSQAGAQNVLAGAGHMLEAEGNFIWSPTKFVAAIGVRNLVVVETPDALLICPRDRSQDVGKIVKWLEEHRRKDLL